MLMINPGLIKPEGVPAPLTAPVGAIPSVTAPPNSVSPPPTAVPTQDEIPTKPNALPSSEEARRHPDLVVSIDDSQPGAQNGSAPRSNVPDKLELDLPPAPVAKPAANASAAFPPVDIGAAQPAPKAAPSPVHVPKPAEPRARGFGSDFSDAIRCIVDAATAYRTNWRSILILTAALMFPALAVESCATTALSGALVPKVVGDTGMVQRYKDLKTRLEEARAKGTLDQQAAAELAALEPMMAVSVAQVSVATGPSTVVVTILRILMALVSGLLIFGIAGPLAYAAGALAATHQLSGAEPPTLAELWPALMRRGQLLLVSLLAVAAIVAVGYTIFVLPGLVASVLLVFVPHVVLFEKRGGKAALLRSLDLVKRDAVRVCVVLLASMVASGIVYRLADLVIPDWGRPLLFVQALLGNVLFVAVMPIFTGALGRLYIDQRQREGVTADELAQSARN